MSQPLVPPRDRRFSLSDYSPAFDGGMNHDEAESAVNPLRAELTELQDTLYADQRFAVLVVLQGIDTAGKDGTIKSVIRDVGPLGCSAVGFGVPTAEEKAHDFLWRYHRHTPEKGKVVIFNRSYYEEVLVVRVHDELLKTQKIPPQRIGKSIWDERCEDIRNFESYLDRNGIIVVKFFLNVSKAEQKRRFIARLGTLRARARRIPINR